ncbi:MAG TPA: hypothetical protein VGD23_12290, partial [Sphingomicrobium sp.]
MIIFGTSGDFSPLPIRGGQDSCIAAPTDKDASSRGRPLLESPLTLPESDETSSERPGRMLALSEDDIESAVRLLRL